MMPLAIKDQAIFLNKTITPIIYRQILHGGILGFLKVIQEYRGYPVIRGFREILVFKEQPAIQERKDQAATRASRAIPVQVFRAIRVKRATRASKELLVIPASKVTRVQILQFQETLEFRAIRELIRPFQATRESREIPEQV